MVDSIFQTPITGTDIKKAASFHRLLESVVFAAEITDNFVATFISLL